MGRRDAVFTSQNFCRSGSEGFRGLEFELYYLFCSYFCSDEEILGVRSDYQIVSATLSGAKNGICT